MNINSIDSIVFCITAILNLPSECWLLLEPLEIVPDFVYLFVYVYILHFLYFFVFLYFFCTFSIFFAFFVDNLPRSAKSSVGESAFIGATGNSYEVRIGKLSPDKLRHKL